MRVNEIASRARGLFSQERHQRNKFIQERRHLSEVGYYRKRALAIDLSRGKWRHTDQLCRCGRGHYSVELDTTEGKPKVWCPCILWGHLMIYGQDYSRPLEDFLIR